MPRWSQIMGTRFDVCACQETRAIEMHVRSLKTHLLQLGYSLLPGVMPQVRKYRKSMMVDKSHPGVATIYCEGTVIVEAPLPVCCQEWSKSGRMQLTLMQTPMGRVRLINCYFPVDDGDRIRMVGDILQCIDDWMDEPTIIMADFNDSLENGQLPTELRLARMDLSADGWPNLSHIRPELEAPYHSH